MKTETNWIEVGKVGTWIAKSGDEATFTTKDLDAIAEAYNPQERVAPLVLGHPEDDDPAYGWTTRFRRVGEILQAKFKQVPEALKEAVDKGHYRTISLALFPDKRTVRHIGLLGAAQPAIPGLKPVSFAAGDYEVYAFSINHNDDKKKEGIMPDEQIKKLEKQLAEQKAAAEALQTQLDQEKTAKEKAATELAAERKTQREREIGSRIDALVEENKILPADKPAVREVALSLGEQGTEIELTSGAGKKRLVGRPSRGGIESTC